MIDFPGKAAAVVYLQGCNFRCPYCKSAELVEPACFGPVIPEEVVMEFLRNKGNNLEAVVITGGEPTIHKELPAFIRRIRHLGLLIKLETNGSNPEMLRELMQEGLLDFIAMDVKAPSANYAQVAGRRVDTELIRDSIWAIKNSNIRHEFRTTVVPGMHTLRELREIGDMVHGCDAYAVQDFVSSAPLRRELAGLAAFPRKPLEDLSRYMERRVEKFIIRAHDEAKRIPIRRRRASPASRIEARAGIG
ncbi:MAG: anaerobic ribonucleoside-triphosphate reductase activating protein [Verrucomicrobia bacterium]|nr:anaerobic ribonucleoside-triphosphate reductase activating protein [Verrucomicrobiota bacterium]